MSMDDWRCCTLWYIFYLEMHIVGYNHDFVKILWTGSELNFPCIPGILPKTAILRNNPRYSGKILSTGL